MVWVPCKRVTTFEYRILAPIFIVLAFSFCNLLFCLMYCNNNIYYYYIHLDSYNIIVCFIFSKFLVASSTSSPGVAARSLACVADVLGAMAGERAGLRSGPARNESWMDAFELLDVCSFGILLACKTPWSYKRTATFMGVQTKAQVALYTIFH